MTENNKKDETSKFKFIIVILLVVILFGVIYISKLQQREYGVTIETLPSDVQIEPSIEVQVNNDYEQYGVTDEEFSVILNKIFEHYPDEKENNLKVNSIDEEGDVLSFTFRSSTKDQYVAKWNKSTKQVDGSIELIKHIKSITEMGTPVYKFDNTQIDMFKSYVEDFSKSEDSVSLCSIDEWSCCYFIYYTQSGNDKYIRVSKEDESVTEYGSVKEGERVKESEG